MSYSIEPIAKTPQLALTNLYAGPEDKSPTGITFEELANSFGTEWDEIDPWERNQDSFNY